MDEKRHAKQAENMESFIDSENLEKKKNHGLYCANFENFGGFY